MREEKVSRDKGKVQAEKEVRRCNRVCRFPDTVANREKKRDALMGLEEGWSHGGLKEEEFRSLRITLLQH